MRKHELYAGFRERDPDKWNYRLHPLLRRAPRILTIIKDDRIHCYINLITRTRQQIAHEVSAFHTLQKARHNGRFYNSEIRYRRRHRKECI